MRPWLLASLAVTLVSTAGLALWPADPGQDDWLAAPAPATAPKAAPTAAAAVPGRPVATGAAPAGLPTRAADWPAPTAAALSAWQGTPPPPAQPPVAAGPPAAQVAQAPRPAFPYRWIGQLDDGGAPQVLLASAQRTVAVRLGATLDGRWRVERAPGGALQARPLPDGEPVPVPGAPAAASPDLPS